MEYSDTVSGSKFSRQGLDALMKEVRRGRIEQVVVYKIDRLGRSLPHLAQLITELSNSGTALIATSQGIDTSSSNPVGRLQMGLLICIAEFEREVIRERVFSGLAAAKARGSRLGRPSSLDQHKASVAALVAQGKGARVISRELGLPLSSVCKLVRAVKAEEAAQPSTQN